jgi:hypothetical protein
MSKKMAARGRDNARGDSIFWRMRLAGQVRLISGLMNHILWKLFEYYQFPGNQSTRSPLTNQ